MSADIYPEIRLALKEFLEKVSSILFFFSEHTNIFFFSFLFFSIHFYPFLFSSTFFYFFLFFFSFPFLSVLFFSFLFIFADIVFQVLRDVVTYVEHRGAKTANLTDV